MTHRDWELRILRARIREVDTEVWISSRGTGGFYILRNSRRTRVHRGVYRDWYIFYDRISWIPDSSVSEGSLRTVCRVRHHNPHIRPGRDQYRSQSQHRPTHRSHTSLRQLWRIISPLDARVCRYPPLDLSTSRVSPTEDHRYILCGTQDRDLKNPSQI